MATRKTYRLVTRSDFDGLVCAAILQEKGVIDEILFVHPKDMQDGKVKITSNDITTNLPYVPGVYLAFDHHLSETIRNEKRKNHIIDPKAPSAARVVYDFLGGQEKLPGISDELIAAVDKADAAQFTREEVLAPTDWVMLNFLMDSRTGLGRFRDFRISNYDLMMLLIEKCRTLSIREILLLPDVYERIELYREHEPWAKKQIQKCATVYNHLVVLNLQHEETIWATNRFMVYAMHPQCSISIHRMWGFKQQNVVFAVGKSILDRSANTNIGELCLSYGGGGHEAAGTLQVDTDKADETERELIQRIVSDR